MNNINSLLFVSRIIHIIQICFQKRKDYGDFFNKTIAIYAGHRPVGAAP